ncbi:unnamed protein product [Caenorhabditis angaria]|uniref:Homeobox domain-containing protein n=1 Tax=Caenorhabditis angaria TaxID=860376 RepID=A0A9P1IRG7_9PELO|nr:unnamed protein product [Caenorhabditis angaria]
MSAFYFSEAQFNCIARTLFSRGILKRDNHYEVSRFLQDFQSHEILQPYQKIKIILTFLEEDYARVKLMISKQNFSPEHFEDLKLLWLEAHCLEIETRRNKQEGRDVLQRFFQKSKYPSREEKKILAKQTNLTTTQVSTFFANQRARLRKLGHLF